MSETAPETTGRGEEAAAGRRGFLTAAATLAGATALAPAALAQRFGPGAPPIRYPDPGIVVLDPERFTAAIDFTSIQRLYTGTLWAEGPAWNGVGRYLVFSDVPGDEQLRWLEEDGHVSRRFRYPSGNLNGNTFDGQGRQISCQHVTRRVVRFEYDGGMTTLAEAFEGKPLNAPNDVVVRRDDGSIWFTDPGNGSLLAYEGTHPDTGSVQPFQKEAIYRIDGRDGRLTKVADQPFKPNGLAFSPGYRTLYAADIGSAYYPEAENIIWRFDVDGDRLTNARKFCSMELNGRSGRVDGIATDIDGNVWASAGWVGEGYDGVHVFAPNGERIGQIRLPEVCSNVCFGGSELNRLFMTASQSLYTLFVETRGAQALGA